jgi:transcriptional regulator GlxA family with amidase domain
MTKVMAMTVHAMESEISAQIIPFSISSGVSVAGDGFMTNDPLLERLVHSLLPPEEAAKVLRGYYTDAFHAKLLQRLGHIRNATAGEDRSRQQLSLPEWRLKRVASFIECNMDQPLSLACLARAAGLSRMHFASLFRRATGLRPHDYVTQQRIERAKQLLSESQVPIVQVALSVGFQSQAHFTTVFKRMAGTTPHRWRLMNGKDEVAA